MNTVSKQFEAMGARVKVRDLTPSRWGEPIAINIRSDKKGEFFDIGVTEGIELQVLQVVPQDRHLVLMTRDGNVKAKYLAGHDERHWFVAAVPESAAVTTVAEAKEALKPASVREIQKKVKPSKRNHRRNSAFKRQGEWFFIPAPEFEADKEEIHRNEPVTRTLNGRIASAHMAEELVRTGGEIVYIVNAVGASKLTLEQRREIRTLPIMTQARHDAFLQERPEARDWQWRTMIQNPEVYVRGTIRHEDHATLDLGQTWHKVEMNTEPQARAMRNVTFLD